MEKKADAAEPQPKKKRDYNVSAEDFIRVWQTSESAQEAAARLGMPKPILLARASHYRSLGVDLKSMPRARRKGLDVEALNRFIQKLAEESRNADPSAGVAPQDRR